MNLQEHIQKQQEEYMNTLNAQLQGEQLRRTNLENQNMQLSSFSPEKESNIIQYQLDLKEELDRIHHLLSGHILEINQDGNEIWEKPKDDRLIILSEYGVKQVMNVIQFYINRNTLLSIYEKDEIIKKVYNFGIEITDLIFNRYESFFYYPTPEQLFERYKDKLKSLNYLITEEELYWKCVKWLQEELCSKIRHFPMIILELMDSIHSTYNRSLRGETLKSLRTMTHISQNLNPPAPTMNAVKPSLFKPSTWGKT